MAPEEAARAFWAEVDRIEAPALATPFFGAFPVLNALDHDAVERASEILMAGQGVGIDFSTVPDVVMLPRRNYEVFLDLLGTPEQRREYAGARLPYVLYDDLGPYVHHWGEPTCPGPLYDTRSIHDWNSPLPHQRADTPRRVTQIRAAGRAPRHPTKGYRRAHKLARKGVR